VRAREVVVEPGGIVGPRVDALLVVGREPPDVTMQVVHGDAVREQGVEMIRRAVQRGDEQVALGLDPPEVVGEKV
jgi:hypothetical protein